MSSARDEWGHFSAEGYGLIGHYSCDVALWLAAHPTFNSYIWFNYGDGGDDIEVTDLFLGEEALVFAPVSLSAIKEREVAA